MDQPGVFTDEHKMPDCYWILTGRTPIYNYLRAINHTRPDGQKVDHIFY
jgi:hypothetical protein